MRGFGYLEHAADIQQRGIFVRDVRPKHAIFLTNGKKNIADITTMPVSQFSNSDKPIEASTFKRAVRIFEAAGQETI